MVKDRYDGLPDGEQRKRIRAGLGVNMLVEAAAGTGKTTMLLERMVELVRTGRCEKISRLAAITFTRKAAAELRSRFQGELEKAASDAAGDEKARLEDALAHVEQCFMGTIHSFCARLLRERPLEAGIDLAFEELDDKADQLLRREAWEEFAAVAVVDDPGGVMERLRAHGLALSDLGDAFDRYARSGDVDEWPASVGSEEMPPAEEINDHIRCFVEHMESVQPTLPDDDGQPWRFKEKYRSIPMKFRQNDPGDLCAAMELVKELDASPPSVSRDVTATLDAETRQLVKAEREEWKSRQAAMDTAGLIDKWFSHRYVVALEVLQATRDHYDTMRGRMGVLNFQDLLIKAASLLRKNPQVRRYFSERFAYVLVDEFQDTDPIQAEMMLLLTATDVTTRDLDWLDCEPRDGALFVVGDPKQSIYRFRRADIATYNLVKAKFDEWQNAEVLELSANFRSVRQVLDFVHESCSTEFEPPGSPTPESPSYVKLEKCRREANEGELTGVKVLRVPCDEDGRADPVEEAEAVARFIAEAVAKGRTVTRPAPSEGAEPEAPEVCYGDFMIITFKKDELDIFAGKLQDLGVPCRVSGSTELANVPELKMLLGCLKAVVNPDNPVLLAAALRSELFGISDQALYRFRKAGGRFDYRRAGAIPGELVDEEREAFAGAFERLERYYLLLSRLPAVSALEKIADDLGLFALAGSRKGGDTAAGSIAKAFEILRGDRAGRWTLPQLLETLEEITSGEVETDGISALPEEPDAVQIMNLHRVKGLQAPVVFLAGVSRPGSFKSDLHVDRSTPRTLGYMEISRSWGKEAWGKASVAHPSGWAEKQEAEDLFSEKEKVRLRYVATTRPESMLVISLSAEQKKVRWSAFEDSLCDAEELDVPPETRATLPEEPAEPPPASPVEAAEAIRARLERASSPSFGLEAAREHALRAPGKPPATRPTPIEREIESLEDVLEDAERGIKWGTVIHALLEMEMAGMAGELAAAAATLLSENDLDPQLAADAAGLVEAVKGSSLWKRAAASGQCLTEVPFSILLGDTALPTLLRGKIDLAFREDNGWVIVDYKTDRTTEQSSEQLRKKYAPQVELYARAWKECTGEDVAEAGLFLVTSGEYARV